MSSLITLKRESRALSIEDFAKEAGISERMARAIESGKSSITVDVALRIAKTLNSTVEELFGEESRCIQEVAPYSDETGVEREGIENVGIFLASKRNKGRVKKEMA
ncbi:MAG: helix-turn-helix transcriptional regulator, partial [Thermoguttaceae bacterium]|nr:helix-turn-helix transcriptional regulator [Thermoguttaceae bacterium]